MLSKLEIKDFVKLFSYASFLSISLFFRIISFVSLLIVLTLGTQHFFKTRSLEMDEQITVQKSFDDLMLLIEKNFLFLEKQIDLDGGEFSLKKRLTRASLLPLALSYSYTLEAGTKTPGFSFKGDDLLIVKPLKQGGHTMSLRLQLESLAQYLQVKGINARLEGSNEGSIKTKSGFSLSYPIEKSNFIITFLRDEKENILISLVVASSLIFIMFIHQILIVWRARYYRKEELNQKNLQIETLEKKIIDSDKENDFLKKKALFLKKQQKTQKRLQEFLDQYQDRSLDKIEGLSSVLKHTLSNSYFADDDKVLEFVQELSRTSKSLRQNDFEICEIAHVELPNLLREVKNFLEADLEKMQISLNIEENKDCNLCVKSDPYVLEIFFIFLFKELVSRCYEGTCLTISYALVHDLVSLDVEIKGEYALEHNDFIEDEIDIGLLRFSRAQLRKLSKNLFLEVTTPGTSKMKIEFQKQEDNTLIRHDNIIQLYA